MQDAPRVRVAVISPVVQTDAIKVVLDSELRSRMKIPVFGPKETSMHTLAAARGRFLVLDVVNEARGLLEARGPYACGGTVTG